MEKNIDIYNKKEKCFLKSKLFYNIENKDIKQIFIFCHGFCSEKCSSSVRVVAEKLLQYEIESISFDFSGHIDSVRNTDKLTVDIFHISILLLIVLKTSMEVMLKFLSLLLALEHTFY